MRDTTAPDVAPESNPRRRPPMAGKIKLPPFHAQRVGRVRRLRADTASYRRGQVSGRSRDGYRTRSLTTVQHECMGAMIHC